MNELKNIHRLLLWAKKIEKKYDFYDDNSNLANDRLRICVEKAEHELKTVQGDKR
jgi:hypothetical protein